MFGGNEYPYAREQVDANDVNAALRTTPRYISLRLLSVKRNSLYIIAVTACRPVIAHFRQRRPVVAQPDYWTTPRDSMNMVHRPTTNPHRGSVDLDSVQTFMGLKT